MKLPGSKARWGSRHQAGLTLTELMIVVVILGMLVAIAYPNDRDFAARAKRNEARSALLRIATDQERFYLNNSTYTTSLTALGFAADPFVTETGSYRVRVMPGANANSYTAEAVYLLGGTEGSTCGRFTIDSAGNKGSTTETDCWTRTR